MEHFYKEVDSEGWFDYQNLYTEMVEKFPNDSHFVEVGSWKGMSACYMAVEIINSNKNIKFDCVDTWKYYDWFTDISEGAFEGVYDVFLKNIDPVKDTINIVRELSWEAPLKYDDNSLDFIFIDASHDYESVKKDIISWLPKLKENGVMAGHDYNHTPVLTAVTEVLGVNNVTPKGSCWVYNK
jgi:predicted O-methyltransferase YrrM